MNLIRAMIVGVLALVIFLLGLLCAIAWRGYGLVSITETVAKNHLVEKGNGAAWPVKITGLLGEISKTSDSVRISADTLKSLLETDAPQTAKSVRDTAAGLAGATASVQTLIDGNGAATAQSVRDAAANVASSAGSIGKILAENGPATAKSIQDAASQLSGVAATANKVLADDASTTAQSIRDAANTAKDLLATEGPATASSIREATEHSAELTAAWARISESLDVWVKRMTAPPTVKQKIAAVLHTTIVFLAHWLG